MPEPETVPVRRIETLKSARQPLGQRDPMPPWSPAALRQSAQLRLHPFPGRCGLPSWPDAAPLDGWMCR